MKIIRSVLAQDVSISAGAVTTYDLPTNPLSHIVLTIKGLNAAAAEASLVQVLATVPKIEVLYKGASIFSGSAADLYVLNCLLLGHEPILTNRVATDDATRALTLYVPMGRTLYNPAECFKAVRKGELQLQLTAIATFAGIDGLIYQIETVELLDATPDKYMKVTTLSKTPTSGADNDIDLAIGNLLAGLLVFSTTVPTGTAWTTSADKLKLLIDNVENMIASMNWESLHGNLLSRIGYLGDYSAAFGNDQLVKYGLIDFMPNGKDDFLVETAGKSSVKLRITAGDANVIRVLPIELATQPE